MVSGEGWGRGDWLYPSPRGGIWGPGEGAMPLPEKNANYIQKRLKLVHIFA